MKAVILAGGLGKRLRPLTFAIPKPLIPVGEKPILEHLLCRLAEQQVREIVLAVGYRAELLELYFRNGGQWELSISYFREAEPLGTAGPLRAIRDQFHLVEPFLVMNADLLTSIDFRKMSAYHREQSAQLTVGWREYRYRLPFGNLEFKDRVLTGIREKPEMLYPASAGIYVLNPEIVELISPGRPLDMPELINRSIREGLKVAAYRIEESWRAIENLEDLGSTPPAP